MPKYIKKEIADLNGVGSTQAYYQLESFRMLKFNEFVEHCHAFNGAFSKAVITGVLAAFCDQLARDIANGYTVRIDGLGTFGGKLGMRKDKEMDGFAEGEPKHNATSIVVNGVSFRVDKELVQKIDSQCYLERGEERRLVAPKYPKAQRVKRAQEYLKKHGFMHVYDYAILTGLSYSSAARELRMLVKDPDSGITSSGRKSSKLYLPASAD